MASVEPNDGSEDVNDFLRRIKELGEKRDKEDAERTRKLEQDILEGRRQREVRRAERARSLSPEKQSPSVTPQNIRSPRVAPTPEINLTSPLPAATLNFNASSHGSVIDTRRETRPVQDVKSIPSPRRTDASNNIIDSENTASVAFDTGASSSNAELLPWQRRGGTLRGPRSRPTSMVEKYTRELQAPELGPVSLLDDAIPSRSQISQALSDKDPSWFRQSSDRIAAAIPRTQENDKTAKHSLPERMRLPGLSATPNLLSSIDSNTRDSVLPVPNVSRANSDVSAMDTATAKSAAGEQEYSTQITPSQLFRPSIPESAIPGIPLSTASDQSLLDGSNSMTRVSLEQSDRPSSPTRGMGGFVQSAMLKRSDSINKRWSVQIPAGTARQEPSIPRGGYRAPVRNGNLTGQIPLGTPRPEPVSNVSDREKCQGLDLLPDPKFSIVSPSQEHISLKPAKYNDVKVDDQIIDVEDRFSSNSRIMSGDVQDVYSKPDTSMPSTPTSPSKRWSPLKATWLESALSKPESPKPKPSAPHQPAWMSEIQRNKKERGQKSGSMSEESFSLHTRAFAPTDGNRTAQDHRKFTVTKEGIETSPSRTKPKPSSNKSSSVPSLENPQSEILTSSESPNSQSDSKPLPNLANKPKFASKPKPALDITSATPVTPPKKDFRSNLKPSNPTGTSQDSDELEFRNIFGKLKRTNTEKYIAPDEFKGNILKGKAGLSVTGGPQKMARKDEFKESILEKKQAMREKASENGTASSQPPQPRGSKPALPEAIIKSRTLGKREISLKEHTGSTNIRETEKNSIHDASGANNFPQSSIIPTFQAVKASQGSGSKIADRFNPELVNILSMRPAPKMSSIKPKNSGLSDIDLGADPHADPRSLTPRQNGISHAPLQHITKSRARGPKRRGPASKVAVQASIQSEQLRLSDHDFQDSVTNSPSTSFQPQPLTPKSMHSVTSRPSTPAKANFLSSIPTTVQQSKDTSQISFASPSPPLPIKPSNLRPTGQLTQDFQNDLDKPGQISAVSISEPSSILKPGEQMLRSEEEFPENSQRECGMRQPEGKTLPKASYLNKKLQSQSGIGKSPKKSPHQMQLNRSQKEQSVLPSKAVDVATLSAQASKSRFSDVPASTKLSSEPLESHIQSFSSIIIELFKEKPVLPPLSRIDASTVFQSNQNHSYAPKTEHKDLREITGDGKATDVPLNQQHILYDRSMYICTHTTSDTNGARNTEVFLWVGSSVPEPTLEDVQLFARKTAKDNNSKLVVLQQGKETESFFQAIGGILVTRRGSPTNNAKSYMLCGRQHLGHVTFDEVDLSFSCLCSGFPFIVADLTGKTYLWKGKGCSAEELGCARLISMDLGQNSDVTEIEEDQETAAFLTVFPKSPNNQTRANEEYWQLKSNTAKFQTRLFQVEATSMAPEVIEITPFTQFDLSPLNIYMLDTYFKIFIIIGRLTHSKAQSFSSALLFAHDYGKLAVANDGRPFVLSSTVVVEGITRDITACFRNWDRGTMPTRSPQNGDSVLIPLEGAISAVQTL